jgi:alginate O-acetyltransferase complex protein AlgI
MIFSSPDFVIFFVALLLLFFFTKGIGIKKAILLLASLFFYAYWDIRLVPLVLALSFFNFYIGKAIDCTRANEGRSRAALIIGIVVNLGVLGYFKYANFFISNIDTIFSGLGLNFSTLKIILPLGISFFIFEYISYLIDVHAGKLRHTDNLIDFLTFSCFFPRLASGPIIRPADFLPQLKKEIAITRANLVEGAQYFTLGLFKKMVIADRLAPFADTVFACPVAFDSVTVWLSVIAYSLQIYCDFSGYSDMALGTARMMGFELPINFNMPYLSKNVTEFWRRWHISLSFWFRDYLYIPLGGNRKGRLRADVYLLTTMLLCGLWHGANWTFVCWGGLHGLGLIVHKTFVKWKEKRSLPKAGRIGSILAWLVTFLFVCVCWVVFRAENFGIAREMMSRMFWPTSGVRWCFLPLLTTAIPFVVLGSVVYRFSGLPSGYLTFDLRRPVPAFGFVLILMTIVFLSATNTSPFIYFQF